MSPPAMRAIVSARLNHPLNKLLLSFSTNGSSRDFSLLLFGVVFAEFFVGKHPKMHVRRPLYNVLGLPLQLLGVLE